MSDDWFGRNTRNASDNVFSAFLGALFGCLLAMIGLGKN